MSNAAKDKHTRTHTQRAARPFVFAHARAQRSLLKHVCIAELYFTQCIRTHARARKSITTKLCHRHTLTAVRRLQNGRTHPQCARVYTYTRTRERAQSYPIIIYVI